METTIAIDFKENDLFAFRFNDEERKKRFEPSHCFDGKLRVRKHHNGTLFLLDTYWGGSGGKMFEVGDVHTKGTLTFICNLDEVEPIQEYEKDYYADADVFNLSYQHGCYKKFAKRKGAERSQAKMLEVIEQKIEEAKRDIDTAQWRLEIREAAKNRIIDGDLTHGF